MPGPTSRLLALLSLLQTPRSWPGSELAERLGVTDRTIRRDIERLRELDYPIAAEEGIHGGYRLIAGSALPPLLLQDDEAVAVALGLRTVASRGLPGLDDAGVRALTKLSNALPAKLKRRVAVLASSTTTWGWPAATTEADPDTLTLLAGAIANTERIRMRYTGRDGSTGRRHTEPQKLISSGPRWYLLGYDLDRDDWRSYRVDRIAAAEPTGARVTHRLPDDQIPRHLTESAAQLGTTHSARITLRLPYAEARTRLGDHLGRGSLAADGTATTWTTHPDSVEWIAWRLLGLDCAFVVHDPPELITFLTKINDRTSGLPAAAAPLAGRQAVPAGEDAGEVVRVRKAQPAGDLGDPEQGLGEQFGGALEPDPLHPEQRR